MSFGISDLLLSADKQAHLTNALANLGIAEPLQTCISEATAEVARYLTGYTVETAAANGFTRSLALYRAYTLAGTGVPPEVQKAYDEAKAELVAIAEGKRKNLPLAATGESSGTGTFGGEPRFDQRTHWDFS